MHKTQTVLNKQSYLNILLIHVVYIYFIIVCLSPYIDFNQLLTDIDTVTKMINTQTFIFCQVMSILFSTSVYVFINMYSLYYLVTDLLLVLFVSCKIKRQGFYRYKVKYVCKSCCL